MSLPTGIEEPQPWSVQLSPNPAAQEVLIQLSEAQPAQITLFDQTGRVHRQQSTSQRESRLVVGNLANGLYLLRVQTNRGTLTRRLLIRH
nr:T9SS type A sorting domain-containing protein [Siphonobacter sp. BAB-5405]